MSSKQPQSASWLGRIGEHWTRSRLANARDYRALAFWLGLEAIVLWPGYGFFCIHVLHLKDNLEVRFVLSLACAVLWWRARSPRTWGKMEHFGWCVQAVVGIGWFPWHLYLVNDRSNYWQMSLVCFAALLPITLRGVDLALGLVALALSVEVVHGSQIGRPEIPLLAVLAFMIAMVATAVHVWRRAQEKIEEQTELLEKQNLRLRALDRSKDEFTANVAHDLRTPLTVALCLTEELAQDRSPQDRQKLESLAGALHQLHRQSQELLEFQRFQLGVAKLDLQEVDLGAWLESFRAGFESMARSKGISFGVSLPPGPQRVRIDPVRMETVLFNLVSNAFKFTPTGSWVEVQLNSPVGAGLVLAVEDGGEGIPLEDINRIFTRFEQLDHGPGTHSAGAGIGLSLVKEIVEAHGGRIHVKSQVGQGSRFEVHLALTLSRTGWQQDLFGNGTETSLPAICAPASRPTILVAEDQSSLLHLLERMLGELADVHSAGDGLEALEMARRLRPDLMVTDNQMPGMNGREVIRKLREDSSTSSIPVILLTGESPEIQDPTPGDTRLTVISKPISKSTLQAQVAHALGIASPASPKALGAESAPSEQEAA